MKSSIVTTSLIWICNIALLILLLALFLSGWYTIRGPLIPDIDREFTSSTSFSITNSVAGRHFIYQFVYDADADQRNEYHYYVPANQIFRFKPDDAPYVDASVMDPDLSESEWFGLKSLNIYAGKEKGVPLLGVIPGYNLDRENFVKAERLHQLFMVLSFTFLLVLFWFLRRFLTGLRKAGFFTNSNALNLRITSWLVFSAPFLHYLWLWFIEPAIAEQIRIEGASLALMPGGGFRFELLIAGLILILIAKAFDQGVKLQQEQDLTI